MTQTRFFTRWNFPPAPFEPAHGYYMRLVRAEGVESVPVFNMWNDVASDQIDPDGYLAIIEAHPMPDEWRRQLRIATPRRDGNVWHLGGETLGSLQISFRTRRWCPGCLHENAAHRTWWDIHPIKHCPIHDIELVDRDPDGRKVAWRWPDFVSSRSGAPLACPVLRRDTHGGFAGYVLGRLGYGTSQAVPLLDSARLKDAIEACQLVGKLVSNRYEELVPADRDTDFETGFRFLKGGLVPVTEEMRRWLRAYCERDLLDSNLHVVAGWFFNRVSGIEDEALRKVLRRALVEARAAEAISLDRAVTEADFEENYISVRDAARRIGFSPKGIMSVSKEIGIVLNPARMKESVPESALPDIADFGRSLIPARQAAKLLGIHSDALRHFTQCGRLHAWRGVKQGRGPALYDRARVAAILAEIDALPVTGSPSHGITFDRLRRRNGMTPGALALDVLAGKYVVAGKREYAEGFSKIVLETGELRRGIPFTRPPETVSLMEAQAILNLSQISSSSLVELGFLTPIQRTRHLITLDRRQVQDFADKHAKVSDFAPGLGMHPTVLFRRLKAAGVEFVLQANVRGQRTETVVRRVDVMRVCGCTVDPALLVDDEFDRFWRMLASRIRESIRTFSVSDRLPRAGQRFWHSAYSFSAVFRFDVETRILNIKSVVTGGFREDHEYPIANPQVVDEILVMLVRKLDQGNATKNARSRRLYQAKTAARRDGVEGAQGGS